MDYEKFKKARKIINLFEQTADKDDKLIRSFHDWYLAPCDKEEKDLAMYLIFESMMADGETGATGEITNEEFNDLAEYYKRNKPDIYDDDLQYGFESADIPVPVKW